MILDMPLLGQQVDLRSATGEDAEFTWTIRQSDRARFVHRLIGTVDDQRLWLEAQAVSDDCYFFIVQDKRGFPLGTISLYDIKDGDEAEEGRSLMFGTPMQNMEAFMLVYDFAFGALGLKRTRSCVFIDNVGVIDIPRKLGAKAVDEKYNEEFGLRQRFYSLKKEDYEMARCKLSRLLERFAGR